MLFRNILVALISFSMCGCAAMIFALGENERNIVNRNSTYTTISKMVGAKPELAILAPPISIEELREKYPKIDVMFDGPSFYKDDSDLKNNYYEVEAVKYSRFIITGRIERKTAVGQSIALSGYTFFIAELFLIPVAISHQLSAGESIHRIDVWFDENDNIIGYLWEESEGI